MSASKNKTKNRIGVIVLLVILGLMFLFAIVCAIRWAVHKTSKDVYGEYEFNNGATQFDLDLFPSLVIDEDATELKIMQITDPQIKFGAFPTRDRKTFSLLERAIINENPDLCVVTGDLTLSIFTYDAIKYFADFMQRLNVKWAYVYGNHDSQFDCSKYTIYKFLKKYDNCLFCRGPSDVNGESNYLVNVFKGEKKAENLVYSLVMLDSGMYPQENAALSDWVYDWIHQDQIDWYTWAINGLRQINADIQTSMFFHIPIKEFADMYYANELAKGNDIPAEIDITTLKEAHDVVGTVCEADKEENEVVDVGYTVGIYYQGKDAAATAHPDVFAAIKQLGSTKAVFCGHDHVNTLKGYYDGIYLGYGLCCGYHTYPFFDSANIITNLFGLNDKALYNGDKWIDENGNKMKKGITSIQISLVDEYGKLNVLDKPS